MTTYKILHNTKQSGKMDWIGSAVYLAGSSKTAPRILIFSIAMSANYSFEVKNIEIWAPAFFKHNNSSIATVMIFLSLLFSFSNHFRYKQLNSEVVNPQFPRMYW